MAEAVTDAYPDPQEDDPAIVVVEIKPGRKFTEPVLLAELRASRFLGDFDPARLPLLSVMPVTNSQWQVIQELAR
jgi:predicted RNA-binding protein with PUA-like domain